MTAPGGSSYTPDPASINTAADVLREFVAREAPDLVPLLFNEGMAMALDEAGWLRVSPWRRKENGS